MTLTKPHPGPEIRIFVRDDSGAEMDIQARAISLQLTPEAQGSDIPLDDRGPFDIDLAKRFMYGSFIGEVDHVIQWSPEAARWRNSWRYKVGTIVFGVIRLASDRIRARIVHSHGTPAKEDGVG